MKFTVSSSWRVINTVNSGARETTLGRVSQVIRTSGSGEWMQVHLAWPEGSQYYYASQLAHACVCKRRRAKA